MRWCVCYGDFHVLRGTLANLPLMASGVWAGLKRFLEVGMAGNVLTKGLG